MAQFVYTQLEMDFGIAQPSARLNEEPSYYVTRCHRAQSPARQFYNMKKALKQLPQLTRARSPQYALQQGNKTLQDHHKHYGEMTRISDSRYIGRTQKVRISTDEQHTRLRYRYEDEAPAEDGFLNHHHAE